MSLRDAWESQAAAWAAWARRPGHDSFWYIGLPHLLTLLPPPGHRTLDVGCGEGRASRELGARGYEVMGVEASPTLARLAAEHDQPTVVANGDAAALPIADAAADLVLASMSLQDVDDLAGAVREIARVLEPGGRLVASVVHPINSAGEFAGQEPQSPFVIPESYFERRAYTDVVERDGMTMTFYSQHHSLEEYARALEDAGLLIEALREPPATLRHADVPKDRWTRIPLFLFVRAVKPG